MTTMRFDIYLCWLLLLRWGYRRRTRVYFLLYVLTLGIDFVIMMLVYSQRLTTLLLILYLNHSFDFLHTLELDELLKNVLPF